MLECKEKRENYRSEVIVENTFHSEVEFVIERSNIELKATVNEQQKSVIHIKARIEKELTLVETNKLNVERKLETTFQVILIQNLLKTA